MRSLPDRPEELLEEWRPADADVWDARKAAHLLRRAGFGDTPDAVAACVARGPGASVDALFETSADGADPADVIRELARTFVQSGNTDKLAAWWLRVMIETAQPLREKVALMWHGHFAVSDEKVESTELMYRQYELFAEHGLGDLTVLAKGVIRDPAMLRFLDADSNRKGHPNENLARELMELFLLGRGHYTERDIQEAARALTGLRVRERRTEYKPKLHDDEVKEVFGASGNFDPDSLVDLCFRKDAAALFLARRFCTFFVHPEPPPGILNGLARKLQAEKFRGGRFLAWLFRTRLFHHPAVYRQLIKSPVELGVGTVRMLEGRVDTNRLAEILAAMGQRLFRPPGVQGWVGGTMWLSSARLAARNRFASAMATRTDGMSYPLEALREQHGGDLDAHLLRRLVDDEVPYGVRSALVAAREAPTDLVHLILTLPEFQLA